MRRVTIDASTEQHAAAICRLIAGFDPVAIRKIGGDDEREGATSAFLCFESEEDAEEWDKENK